MGNIRQPQMTLLTTKQAAKLLSVHPKHVYRLLKQGLPAARVGSEWRFDRDAVMAWTKGETLERAAVPPVPDPPPAVGAPRVDSAPPPLVAANGDLVIDELLGLLQAEAAPLLGFVLADQLKARAHLLENRVLFAGAHEDVPIRSVSSTKVARLHLATREIGLATASPKPLTRLSQVVGKRLALRPDSAGVRAQLDQSLVRGGVSLERAYKHAKEYASHREVVLSVAGGLTDIGLTTHAWASVANLSFFPIGSESYGLSVRIDCLSDPRVVRLVEITQGAALRRLLRDRHGYGVEHTGELKFA